MFRRLRHLFDYFCFAGAAWKHEMDEEVARASNDGRPVGRRGMPAGRGAPRRAHRVRRRGTGEGKDARRHWWDPRCRCCCRMRATPGAGSAGGLRSRPLRSSRWRWESVSIPPSSASSTACCCARCRTIIRSGWCASGPVTATPAMRARRSPARCWRDRAAQSFPGGRRGNLGGRARTFTGGDPEQVKMRARHAQFLRCARGARGARAARSSRRTRDSGRDAHRRDSSAAASVGNREVLRQGPATWTARRRSRACCPRVPAAVRARCQHPAGRADLRHVRPESARR